MVAETKKIKAETKLAVDLVRNFEALAPLSLRDRKNGKRVGNEMIPGWQVRAIETSQFIKSQYELPQSALSAKKRLLAELSKFDKSWLLDAATYHPVKTTITHFRECLNLLFSEYQASINEKYLERVDLRSSDEKRIICDVSPYLRKAFEVLTAVANGASRNDVKWEDVSCALALVTGRRMSELHYSAEFEVTGHYELSFRGQLKGKARLVGSDKLIDHTFIILTLIPADLVVAGMAWLDREGKRADRANGTPEQVNKTWGKYLSRRAKSDWEIIKDAEWQEVDALDKWTYHKFRGLYLICCLANLQEMVSYASIQRKAPSLIGDQDMKALEPYLRVDIAPGSLTKI